MEWKDVGSAIADFAPGLAGVLGGVFGGGVVGNLASTGVAAVCTALGLKSKPNRMRFLKLSKLIQRQS